MTTRFKFFFLLMSMMLCVSLNSWAYDDWTSTNTNTGSGWSYSSNTWNNIEIPAGKYLLVDYEVNGGEKDYLYFYCHNSRNISGKAKGTIVAYYNSFSYTSNRYISTTYYRANGGSGYAKVTNIRIADAAPKFTAISLGEDFELGVYTQKTIKMFSQPLSTENYLLSSLVTWKSSNTSVATVDNNGNVEGVGAGTATITCTANDGSGVSGSCKVTVNKVEKIVLHDTYIGLKDESCQLSLSVTPNCCSTYNRNYTWKSSDENILTVDSYGVIKAVAEGTATVTATAKDGSGVSGSCKVTVYPDYTWTSQSSNVSFDYSYTSSEWSDLYVKEYNGYYEFSENWETNFNHYYLTRQSGNLRVEFTLSGYSYFYVSGYKNEASVSFSLNDENIEIDTGWNSDNFHSKKSQILPPGKYCLEANYDIEGSKGFFSLDGLEIGQYTATNFDEIVAKDKVVMDVVTVSREGILGAEALKIHDNLTDFKGLKVVGPLDEYDWKTIDEMNLICLDLTEASGVYPSSGKFSTIQAVKMSNKISDIARNYFPYARYVYIPDGVTSLSSGIGSTQGYFSNNNYDCLLTIEGCKGVKTISNSAFSRGKEASGYLTGTLSLDNLETLGDSAFYNCMTLKSVSMPKVKSIGKHAFNGCEGLQSVTMPNVTEVGKYAFSNCNNLGDINAPKLARIAPYTFFNSKMKNASFAIADSIGTWAFAAAEASKVSCPKAQYVGNSAFSGTYSIKTNYWGNDITSSENRVDAVEIPSVEVICDSTFYRQNKIEKLVTPSLKRIGEYAFYYSRKLSSVDLSSVMEIGKYAFYNCDSLKRISLPNVTRIEESTFYFCHSIKSLDAPRVTYIGKNAFYYASNLQTANISKADTICESAFNICSKLQAVNLPKINYIGKEAFSGCSSVKTIDLSDKLTELGENCFYGCTGVETLTLPASITKIPTQCFAGSNNIKTINCNAPAPPAVGETPFNMQTLYTAKLRVPEPSIVLYQSDNYWKHFYYFETNPDVLTDLIISNPTDMGDVRMEKVNLTLKAGASLAMTGNDAQSFRSVLFMANSNESGMFISKSERITSDATKIELDMPALKWRFITLPYDVNISDIERSVEDAQMAIYKYDGSKRASSGTGYAWTRVNSGTLTAGTGYIIQTSKATALTFPAPYAHKDKPFQPYDVTTKLAANTSSTAANQGWNFVGNPYMAYYDISKLELNAPITVWNGTTYNAYSPKDDEYALRPMQPFFVQCPANVKSLKFNADGRQATSTITKATEARARYNVKDNAERKVVDIAISTEGETPADRTRFVINNKATDDYELSCDAAKMMSMDENVAQIYTVSRGIQYAINEGPQLAGKVMIGIVTPKAGKYTLNALRSDMDVMLHDEETGETVNLTEGAYTFDAGEGVNESRFYVVLGNETTKVSGVAADGINGTTEVYDLDGRRKDEATKGVNIIRQNGKVSKQMNR